MSWIADHSVVDWRNHSSLPEIFVVHRFLNFSFQNSPLLHFTLLSIFQCAGQDSGNSSSKLIRILIIFIHHANLTWQGLNQHLWTFMNFYCGSVLILSEFGQVSCKLNCPLYCSTVWTAIAQVQHNPFIVWCLCSLPVDQPCPFRSFSFRLFFQQWFFICQFALLLLDSLMLDIHLILIGLGSNQAKYSAILEPIYHSVTTTICSLVLCSLVLVLDSYRRTYQYQLIMFSLMYRERDCTLSANN